MAQIGDKRQERGNSGTRDETAKTRGKRLDIGKKREGTQEIGDRIENLEVRRERCFLPSYL